MMDKRSAAGVLAQCKWLKDRIKEWEAEAKDVLMGELDAGEKSTAIAPDGAKLGLVTKAKGKRSMRIDNEDGFLAWVKMRYPTEVTEAVRPAFVKVCQEKVVNLGGLPDANGELCPHVSLHEGEQYTFVTLDPLADHLITEAIKARKLLDVITPPSELPQVVQGDSAIAGAAHEAAEWREAIPDGPPVDMSDVTLGPRYDGPTESGSIDVYDGPLDDTTQAMADYEMHAPGRFTVDPEPDLSDRQVGPPNWGDSNTFENDPNVKRKRGTE